MVEVPAVRKSKLKTFTFGTTSYMYPNTWKEVNTVILLRLLVQCARLLEYPHLESPSCVHGRVECACISCLLHTGTTDYVVQAEMAYRNLYGAHFGSACSEEK